MTYIYVFEKPITDLNDTYSWFTKTYQSIERWNRRDIDKVDRDYEKKFNVELIYVETASKNDVKPIAAIKFPSEGDAMLFLLRWT